MQTAAELLMAMVALYPVVTAALWVAGGVLFRVSRRAGRTTLRRADGPA